jgi:hypothetical protein
MSNENPAGKVVELNEQSCVCIVQESSDETPMTVIVFGLPAIASPPALTSRLYDPRMSTVMLASMPSHRPGDQVWLVLVHESTSVATIRSPSLFRHSARIGGLKMYPP